MSTYFYIVTSVDDGRIENSTHRTMESAEEQVRHLWRSRVRVGKQPHDIEDVLEQLAEYGLDAVIDSHPLRGIATDTTSIDQELLAEQVCTLSEVIARCDADADSSQVTISFEESERLEGIWNLAVGLLDDPHPAVHPQPNRV